MAPRLVIGRTLEGREAENKMWISRYGSEASQVREFYWRPSPALALFSSDALEEGRTGGQITCLLFTKPSAVLRSPPSFLYVHAHLSVRPFARCVYVRATGDWKREAAASTSTYRLQTRVKRRDNCRSKYQQ